MATLDNLACYTELVTENVILLGRGQSEFSAPLPTQIDGFFILDQVKRWLQCYLLQCVVECEAVSMYHECMGLLGKLFHFNSPDV